MTPVESAWRRPEQSGRPLPAIKARPPATKGSGPTKSGKPLRPLPRRFFARPPHLVAPELIGHWIVRQMGKRAWRAQIIETEAYLGVNDPAAHAAAGLTRRTAVLYGEPGHAYIYLIYGLHLCLNAAAHEPGVAGGVLFRAAGEWSGPGRLTRGLNIPLALNGCDLTAAGPLFLARGERWAGTIAVTARVGIQKARELPLRFYWEGHPSVTRPRGPVLERRCFETAN